jgi:DNA-binding transcriptional ArsR family regulator
LAIDPPTSEPVLLRDGTVDYAALASELDALANGRRLALLQFLTERRGAEEIGARLGISRQSAVKHLEKLVGAGFVRALPARRGAAGVEYMTVPSRLYAVCVALNDLSRKNAQGARSLLASDRTMDGSPEVEADALSEGPKLKRAGSAILTVVAGPSSGTRLVLPKTGSVLIGRDNAAGLSIPGDPYVSASHAEVRSALRGWILEDLGSSNGTALNFISLPKGSKAPLKLGDVIGIGHSALVLQPTEEGAEASGRPMV